MQRISGELGACLCALQYEPYQKKTVLNNGTVVYTGIIMQVVEALAQFLNFK